MCFTLQILIASFISLITHKVEYPFKYSLAFTLFLFECLSVPFLSLFPIMVCIFLNLLLIYSLKLEKLTLHLLYMLQIFFLAPEVTFKPIYFCRSLFLFCQDLSILAFIFFFFSFFLSLSLCLCLCLPHSLPHVQVHAIFLEAWKELPQQYIYNF